VDDNIRPALNKVQSMVTDFEQVGAVGQLDSLCICCCTLQAFAMCVTQAPLARLPEQHGWSAAAASCTELHA
jgi:hypothetical protein